MNEPITWGSFFKWYFLSDVVIIGVVVLIIGIILLCKYLDNDGKKWFKDEEGGENESRHNNRHIS